MRYGFIGAGNIAMALITGAVQSGKISTADIGVYNLDSRMQKALTDSTGVTGFETAEEVLAASDVVVFAVKPHVLVEILPNFRDFLAINKQIVVSVAAGVELQKLEELLPGEMPVIRVMPNLNSLVGVGMTAYCTNEFATPAHKDIVAEFFSASGMFVELDEKFFAIFSALAGSSPAFAYLFIDSLAKSAHKLGMNKQDALRIAAQAVLGSAKMLLETSEHPWALIDKVCSPGGMTIEGICSLQEHGFESAVVDALECAINKSSNLVK